MRYLLFGGTSRREVDGGAHDYLACDDDKGRLVESNLITEKEYDTIVWWHIFDTQTKKIVAKSLEQSQSASSYDDTW